MENRILLKYTGTNIEDTEVEYRYESAEVSLPITLYRNPKNQIREIKFSFSYPGVESTELTFDFIDQEVNSIGEMFSYYITSSLRSRKEGVIIAGTLSRIKMQQNSVDNFLFLLQLPYESSIQLPFNIDWEI